MYFSAENGRCSSCVGLFTMISGVIFTEKSQELLRDFVLLNNVEKTAYRNNIYMLRTNLNPAASFKAVQTVLKPAGPF